MNMLNFQEAEGAEVVESFFSMYARDSRLLQKFDM